MSPKLRKYVLALEKALKAAIRTPNMCTTDQETGETPFDLMQKALDLGKAAKKEE